MDAALVWSKPIEYFGDSTVFGKTKAEIQQNLKAKYNNGKVQILVSAFGPQEMPTSSGYSWQDCANGLASFVLDNNLDGCDINWQDTSALSDGSGSKWLNSFQSHLRKLLPNHTIVHSPMAGYFNPVAFSKGSYLDVNTQEAKSINFYNIQYYNQGTSKYNNYTEIFLQSSGAHPSTSVAELVRVGVQQSKIVIGKPIAPSDITGSGWIDTGALGLYISQAYDDFQWFSGVALWQYSSDVRGKAMTSAAGHLK
jgi:chitinase